MSGTVVRSPDEAVRGWPEETRVVALVSTAEGGGISFDAMDLMEGLADRWRPALLASVEPGAGLPDEGGVGSNGGGLASVVRGEATLKDVARARPDRSFAFLPAGEGVGAAELLESPALRRLAEGVRSAGGILVVHVPAGVEAAVPPWLEARMLEGSPEGEPPSFGSELPMMGALAVDAGGSEAGGGERWRRHRRERGAPVARVVAAVVGLAVIVGGWWFLARESVDLPGDGASPAADTAARVEPPADSAAPAEATPADTASDGGTPGAAGAEATDEGGEAAAGPGEAAASAGEVAAAPELPYSVLVASYRQAGDARERVEQLRESVTLPVFASPTPVTDGTFHRVFAGVHPDTASAAALMRSLADRGLKRSVSSWDLRPARWSLLLGRFEGEEAAREARSALGEAAVHAYVLTRSAGGETSYLLYAGAFESSEAAAPLQETLAGAGHETELLIRRGEPR